MSLRNHTHFVIEQYGTSWLNEVLINKGQHVDIVLGAHGGGDDSMIVIYDLLQSTDGHRSTSQIIYLRPLLLYTIHHYHN